ncbi:diaminopimelate decarboxylase [Candidatus Woesearchaeota archaeon]|nr:diaminopimelate decarboxylase [Candidatus Woesearchaeota archaeon]
MLKLRERPPFTKEQAEKWIADSKPTPFHVYEQEGIISAAHDFNSAFEWVSKHSEGFKNFFAVKALPNTYTLELLREEAGFGADCSSGPELDLAEAAGILRNNAIYTSNDTPDNEFREAHEFGAIINLDDIKHIDAFERAVGCFPELICFRYNPGEKIKGNNIIGNPLEAKYGVPDHKIVEAYRRAIAKGAKRFGLHTMVCSNEREEESLIGTAKMMLGLAGRLHDELGIDFEFINLGGGVGIPYRPEDKSVDVELFANSVRKAYEEMILDKGLKPPRIVMECGRAITGLHGWLVARVLHVTDKYRSYVGLDASMSDLMRPALYSEGQSAEGECYHHITVLGKEDPPKDSIYDVTGPLCENNDKFARQRPLPKIEEGDLIAIHNTGAHGWAMGFNYNARLKHAEYLLHKDGSLEMIRRAQTRKDYFATLDFPGSKFAHLAGK